MRDLTTDFDVDVPEYIDEFRRYLPDLELVMVQLEAKPNAKLMAQAYEFLSALKQSLTVSTDMIIISVAESIGDLSIVLNVMIKSDTYFKGFSDLVLLVFDRLAELIRDIEHDVTLDFELSQAIHIALQPLKEKLSVETLESKICTALNLLVNPRITTKGNSATGSDIELFDDVELFAGEETEQKPKDDIYKMYQEALAFLENSERLELESLLGESTHKQRHSSFIIPMALTLNKMLGSPVTEAALHQAVLFHDIGERVFPQSIYSAKKFTALEYQLVKSHPLISGATLKTFVSTEVVEIIEQHHECVDGSGYPYGLNKDTICIGAKILSLCDAFDAMTQQRPHKPVKRSFLRAVAEINACRGAQFDNAVVQVFNQLMLCKQIREEAPGSRGDAPL